MVEKNVPEQTAGARTTQGSRDIEGWRSVGARTRAAGWVAACVSVVAAACGPRRQPPPPPQPEPTTTTTTQAPTTTSPSTEPPGPAELERVQQALTQTCSCDAGMQPSRPELGQHTPPRDVGLRDVNTCSTREAQCHACFSCFGWQLFLSLNWPAAAESNPKFGAPGVTSPVTWEAYKSASEVFTSSAPSAWGINAPKSMVATTAVIHLTEALQADNNWLTDRSGNVVYYESRVNKDEFDYIVANKLYSQQGQVKAMTTGAGIDLPDGGEAPYSEGAIEVKAAWRVVPEAERARFTSRYKLAEAVIGQEQRSVTVALIGLHLIKKTPSSPQWVWATFEHEDNAPDVGHAEAGKYYNLYNPELAAAYTPNQSTPPSKFDTPPTPRDRAVQVSRLDPITTGSKQLNDLVHRLITLQFADSVFAHYQLVNVQWALQPAATNPKAGKPLPTGSPTPVALANVVMETYMQEKSSGGGAALNDPSSPEHGKSSCIGCHSLTAITPTWASGVSVPSGSPRHWFTDYSALFFRAQKQAQ